jgi:ketosteroid isomerase-like protein
MRRKIEKSLLGLIVIAFCLVVAASAFDDETDARFFRQFERDWLSANLNNGGRWIEMLTAGKLEVRPGSLESIKQRERFTTVLPDPSVPDNAGKVRISGTVSFLTSDPEKNRSFQFLDTFNRRGGQWEVIASSFSPVTGSRPGSKEQFEKEIRKLDMEAAKAILDKNEAAIARFFTQDSVTNNPRNSLTHGSAGVIEAARTGLIDYHSFERVIESVQILGNTAVVMGNETVVMKDRTGGPGETLKRRYTNVWMKTGENWQIVARHASIIGL